MAKGPNKKQRKKGKAYATADANHWYRRIAKEMKQSTTIKVNPSWYLK